MEQYDLDSILREAPDNFVIRDALVTCHDTVAAYNKIVCSISGGGDSDVMLDMLLRCGAKGKTDFVFFNTGLEYAATLEHLDALEAKYGIQIQRVNALKSIPACVKEYGVPFLSKFASDMICRLQSHGFQWEDEPFDVLMEQYPKCKTALEWWCNQSTSQKNTQWVIRRNPYLKEFMLANPPTFQISDKCCLYAKKYVAKKFMKGKDYDLSCTGVRRSEGGVRAGNYKTCFDEGKGDIANFRPIFWLCNGDKEEYCAHYNITHSRCYTEYGLQRTGCFGCPFGRHFDEELQAIASHEPKLLKAAQNVFAESYEYTRAYREFKAACKENKTI